jgi:hypothetical protein
LLTAAALPAVSDAATTNVKQTPGYTVTVDKGVLAGGGATVKAKVVVTDPEKRVSGWYGRATIQKVVRKAANQGIERPFTYQGYRIVPVLNGNTAKYTGNLRGGDVPTTVKLTFTVPFKAA